MFTRPLLRQTTFSPASLERGLAGLAAALTVAAVAGAHLSKRTTFPGPPKAVASISVGTRVAVAAADQAVPSAVGRSTPATPTTAATSDGRAVPRTPGQRRVMPLEQHTVAAAPAHVPDLGDDDPLARTPIQDLTGMTRGAASGAPGLPMLAPAAADPAASSVAQPDTLPGPPPAPPLSSTEGDFADLERQEVPAALRDRYRNVAAHGSVTVLAVRVSHQGRALQVEVLVPSANALTDIGYVLGMSQLQLGPIDPPLSPGESRWIDVPINNNPNSVLP